MQEQVVHKTSISLVFSPVRDFAELVKFRLTLMVVLTALGAFYTAGGVDISALGLFLLGIGGFCVAGASNAMNQVLETDFDKLMKRTQNRPVVTGRISQSRAVMIAGFLCLAGVTILSLFNMLAALFGMIAFILYAFVYTPLKRHSSAAVLVGAVAGAMPMLIGVVAWEGEITALALLLFLIQFSWQYPHFWSIGYLGFEDYMAAGFRFVPQENGTPTRRIAYSSLIHSLLLLVFSVGLWWADYVSIIALTALLILAAAFSLTSWKFIRSFDRVSARNLMFASLLYMPVLLMILFTNKFFG